MPIDFQIEEIPEKKGGKIAVKNIKGLLKKSYSDDLGDYNDYILDKELSDPRVQVYKKKGTNEAAVVHRGTKGLNDYLTDLQLTLGFDISNTERAKHSKKIQKEAEHKYGKTNISTLGHSLGSKLASDVGQDSKEIININKAVAPQDLYKKQSDKEFNIRSSGDPVSALLHENKNNITIPSISFNPFTEHRTDILDRLDPEMEIGRGHLKKMTMKQLKSLVKKIPKKEPYNLTGKKKGELIDYCCLRCGLE